MFTVCVGDVIHVVFSVCIVWPGAVGGRVGKCECFVMQIVYVCALCASCDSPQCCVMPRRLAVY